MQNRSESSILQNGLEVIYSFTAEYIEKSILGYVYHISLELMQIIISSAVNIEAEFWFLTCTKVVHFSSENIYALRFCTTSLVGKTKSAMDCSISIFFSFQEVTKL